MYSDKNVITLSFIAKKMQKKDCLPLFKPRLSGYRIKIKKYICLFFITC